MTTSITKILNRFGIGKTIAKDGFWSFTLKAINTVLGFATTVLLARMLGAEGYGIYAYAYAWAILFAIPTQAGLPQLVMRETALGIASNRPDLVKGVWRWAGRAVAALSLTVVTIVGPIMILWQGGLTSPQTITMAWAMALIPLMALGNIRGAALRGLKRIIAGQLPEFVLRPGLLVIFIFAASLVLGKQLSPDLAMALHVGAALLAFLWGAWNLSHNTPPEVRQAASISESPKWLISSLLFALISSFEIINRQISTIALGFFATSDQVGIYKVAAQLATLAAFGLQAVNLVVAPRFADLYNQGKMARLQQLVTGSARTILVVNLVLTALFTITGQPFFIIVFGSEFAASYTPLLVLLVGQVVNSSTGSAALLLNMSGHERETARDMAVAATLNIVLNLLLIPFWGIHGAAIASSISMILWNILLWRTIRIKLGINSFAFNIGKKMVF